LSSFTRSRSAKTLCFALLIIFTLSILSSSSRSFASDSDLTLSCTLPAGYSGGSFSCTATDPDESQGNMVNFAVSSNAFMVLTGNLGQNAASCKLSSGKCSVTFNPTTIGLGNATITATDGESGEKRSVYLYYADFLTFCSQTASKGQTISCYAADYDGIPTPSIQSSIKNGRENGEFVIFTAHPSSGVTLNSNSAYCYWLPSHATGAKTPAQCGPVQFTVTSSTGGSVTFSAVDYVSGTPSKPGKVDGSDSCPHSTNVCSSTTTVTPPVGVPEFPLGLIGVFLIAVPALVVLRKKLLLLPPPTSSPPST
jgi:hypothetical protein